ncbi:Enoyl-[acyl-carrier-protein] reductase, mitochondrial [Pseudolycoriella hygida]|uniref:Enoyl-[acyl-carrier-protein] reductase, mitochondrial n=1 Tax=Pseudolycoriella hygida TaxID=35572 RepID=A0A9Q0MLE7_9DIPT|nr:Enoyl-[acyl-carrier-protein] reductase, mitochondrial [Pseudolycoriella hygida]
MLKLSRTLNSFSAVPIRSMSVLSTYLKYSEYGEPVGVLKKFEETLNEPENDQVLLKILVSPVNPADINVIQGKYPEKPPLPAVPGNECVAEVMACGPNTKSLQPGDRVIPFVTQLGTWRTHALFEENKLLKVPKELGLVQAATITVNPPTAYRMLKDFVPVKRGDTIIQNGANSAVGQAVFQLSKLWGIQSVGIVRNRPDIDDLKSFLLELGASEVLTEEELRTTTIFKSGALPKPKLAFNCVGGRSSTELLRHLDDKGVMVTYGAMSREPVTAPNAALIFKDISFRGFWMSRWGRENLHSAVRREMLDELIEIILCGDLKEPVHQMIPFEDWENALKGATNFTGFSGGKYIFDFRE